MEEGGRKRQKKWKGKNNKKWPGPRTRQSRAGKERKHGMDSKKGATRGGGEGVRELRTDRTKHMCCNVRTVEQFRGTSGQQRPTCRQARSNLQPIVSEMSSSTACNLFSLLLLPFHPATRRLLCHYHLHRLSAPQRRLPPCQEPTTTRQLDLSKSRASGKQQ